MKKGLLLTLIVVLAMCLCLAACTSNEAPADNGEGPAPAGNVNLTMGTGGTSGTYYAFGGALATVLNNAGLGLNIQVTSSGASGENIKNIGSGDVQLAILQNDVLDYAYNGTNTWEGNDPVTNVYVLGALYPEVVQLVATADSGITSVADLAGKRVSIGDIGSGVETNAKQILAAYGLSTDDIKVQNLGFGDSADAIKNNTLDAVFITAGAPNTAVLDLATSRNLVIIPIDGDEAASLMNDYPFYAEATITPDDYSFLTDPVTTIAVQATLVCGESVTDEQAYTIVKGIFDNKEALVTAHEKGKYIDPAYALEGVSLALQPGAEKYYKELGLL
ncbi:MAG: TAXI family TRAP transporter solute-binding subunit [Firmicutes bacterium]|nr:TAXI family TRAP transporter solute-binding subunit [Bacillota bacterium]